LYQLHSGCQLIFSYGQGGYSQVNIGTLNPPPGPNQGPNTGGPNTGGPVTNPQVWANIRQRLVQLVHPQLNDKLGPAFLRLAFHDQGTYNKSINKGGGATVQFMLNEPQNGGLERPINALKLIQQQNPGVSLADLIIFAACVGINTLGGPSITFRPGRRDLTPQDAQEILNAHPDKNLLLPKPNHEELMRTFYAKYGFGDREIVLFNGAHTLGHTNIPDGKFRGWSRNMQKFDNDYFVRVYQEQWPVFPFPGAPGKNFWKTPDDALILFETDFILRTDNSFIQIGQDYMRNNDKFFRDFAQMFQVFGELGWSNLGNPVF